MALEGGDAKRDILEVFRRSAAPYEPLTVDEVADAVDCDCRTVEQQLETLVDRGHLGTKLVGESGRVWWRLPVTEGYVEGATESGMEPSELYRLTLANLSDTVFVTDDDGKFTYVCPNVHFIFGHEADEVAEMGTVEALLGPDLFDPDELDRRGELQNIERTISDKNGDEHRLLITVKSVSLGAGSLLFACRDVTELKKREEELREARSQNDRLERFADMLAHELRSPLEIAQLYLRFAEDGDPSAFEEVDYAHERIEETIDVLLVLAKGKAAITETESIDVGEAARKAWETVDPGRSDLAVDDPPTIRAQSAHVQHLLTNLLKNAVEHGANGATVRIGALDDGFYVADDGPGIPPDERETVFEPGYTTDSKGIGLGLTLVGEVAEAYGWDYAIADSEAGGARFEFGNVEVAPSER